MCGCVYVWVWKAYKLAIKCSNNEPIPTLACSPLPNCNAWTALYKYIWAYSVALRIASCSYTTYYRMYAHRLRLPFEGPPWRSFPIFVWYLSYFLCDFFLVFRNACFTFVYSSEYNLNGNRCLKSKDNEAGIIQRCDAHSFILSTLKQIYIIKWIYSCQRW